jgi:hypothetical protein
MQTETSFVKSTQHRKLSTSFKKKLEHSTLFENSEPFHASLIFVIMTSQPLLRHLDHSRRFTQLQTVMSNIFGYSIHGTLGFQHPLLKPMVFLVTPALTHLLFSVIQ